MTEHVTHIWRPTNTSGDAFAYCDCGWEEDAPTPGIARDLADQHRQDVSA